MNEEEVTLKKHIEFKDMILLIMVLFVCAALLGYGAFLKYAGYDLRSGGVCGLFELSTSCIREGVYPWNYQDGLLKQDENMYAVSASAPHLMEYEDYLAKSYNRSEDNIDPVEESETEEYDIYKDENIKGLYASLEGERIFSDLDLYNIHEIPLSGMEAHIYEEQEKRKEAEEASSSGESIEESVIEPMQYEFTTVDDSYFDDAVFIGDSRMVGVCEYSGITNADYFAKTAMTIYGLMECNASTDPLGRTVRQGLTDKQYSKVYIMVGINELGTGDTEYFINKYSAVLDEIRELQPDAIIYIQGIMHVAHARDVSDAYINNTNINERNQALSALADGRTTFYIDVNPIFDDANGDLNKEYTSDDVHLYANNYAAWHTFFLEHAVVVP